MKLSFIVHWKMRSKAILIVVLILVLAGMGTLTVLYQTGRLGTKADTNLKTVKVSGKFTDAVTNQPVPNAKIVIGTYNENATPVYATTNNDGNYSTTINVNLTDPMQGMIFVKQDNAGYPQGEGSLYDQAVPVLNKSTVALTQDFQLSKLPQEAVSTTKLDPVSEKCRTKQLNPEDTYLDPIYHNGDYYGKYVNNVLFCVELTDKKFFEKYSQDIADNAKQINFLVSQTKLPYTPTIYLVDRITWGYGGPGAYAEVGSRGITTNVEKVENVVDITHEVGHLVDWWKGFDPKGTDSSLPGQFMYCYYNNGGTKKWCFSSQALDFYSAYQLNEISKNFSGYCHIGLKEMFAEIFTVQYAKNDQDMLVFRERMQHAIKNMLLGSYTFKWSYSEFSALGNPAGQNAAMYLYKFVAHQSSGDEYFPGKIDRWKYDQIAKGQYMDVGVVSTRLKDHTSRPMEEVSVAVSDKNFQTRLKKDSGVFPDGSGDLFDTTGTNVFLNASVGSKETIDIADPPDYYQGAVFNPLKKDIIQGSNPVINLSYTLLTRNV